MGSVAQTGLLLVPSDALPRPHLGLTWGPRGRAGFALRNWHGDAIDWTEGDALDAFKDASKGCAMALLFPAVAALSVQAPARRRLDVTCPTSVCDFICEPSECTLPSCTTLCSECCSPAAPPPPPPPPRGRGFFFGLASCITRAWILILLRSSTLCVSFAESSPTIRVVVTLVS